MTGDIEKLSFEEAMRELESIVSTLETGKVSLDNAVQAYERGAALKAHCEAMLKAAHMRVEQISIGPDRTIATVPFEIDTPKSS